ncbi:hypothetical protein ACQRMY_005103, partial [Pseudomonas aeruginosa]
MRATLVAGGLTRGPTSAKLARKQDPRLTPASRGDIIGVRMSLSIGLIAVVALVYMAILFA